MPKYKLYVRDEIYRRVAEIDNYQSLTLKPQFNNVGTWTLTMPMKSDAAYQIIQPGYGIVVVRDGQTIFSGSVNQRNRKWDVSNDTLQLDGFDDNQILKRYLAFPSQTGLPFTTDYDVRTGPAETVIKQYINANIYQGQVQRAENITIETDQARGQTVTGQARLQTLLDLCISLALAGGDLGFRMIQSGQWPEFQVYVPQDKTKSVIFSPLLGNLISFDYTETNPQANYVITGGTGEGTNRTFVDGRDSNSMVTYGRYEEFLDSRDTTDTTQLQQSVDTELSQKANQTNLSMTTTDTDGMAFIHDYNLGDKVTAILTQPEIIQETDELDYFISLYQTGSMTVEKLKEIQTVATVITDVIRQVTITIDQNGETINPVIGSPDSTVRAGLNIFSKMKQMDRRLINLERV